MSVVVKQGGWIEIGDDTRITVLYIDKASLAKRRVVLSINDSEVVTIRSHESTSLGDGITVKVSLFEDYVTLDVKAPEGVDIKKEKKKDVSRTIKFIHKENHVGCYIGMPIGICITEGILFFVCLYVSVILPQSKWKEINAKQNEIDKLAQVMRKI